MTLKHIKKIAPKSGTTSQNSHGPQSLQLDPGTGNGCIPVQ